MRVFAYLAAGLLAIFGTPASAALLISINNVTATGVQTQTFGVADFVNCPPFGICPNIVQPYQTTVSGFLNPLVNSLSGVVSLTGQDRARSGFGVTLVFQGSTFVSSSLSGEVFFGAPSSTGSNSATFFANNFAITVRDLDTGVTRIIAPIPEPATWAMMLMGFGAIGFSIRRRRVRASI